MAARWRTPLTPLRSSVLLVQSTVSESTLVALLAARRDRLLQLQAEVDQPVDDSVLNSRLVAYASDQVSTDSFSYVHIFTVCTTT